MPTDLAIDLYLYAHPVAWLTPVMIFVTKLGSLAVPWLLLGGLLLIKKDTRYAGVAVLAALALDLVLVSCVIKPFFMRPRPYQVCPVPLLIAPPLGSSFPSAHASTSFASVCAFCMLVHKRPLANLRVPLVLLAALIAFSRLYLFVHYPSDVVAGALIGFLTAWFVVWAMERLYAAGRLGFLNLPQNAPKLLS